MICQKSLPESCRMGRCIVGMKLICSLGHSENDDHTVHTLSQRCLTANWLAPRENDCSRMYSKVSSDWLPSYIKAMRPVLELFKMVEYFPDSPRMWWDLQITTLLIMTCLPLFYHFLPVRPKYLPQRHILQHPQTLFFRICQRPGA